MEGRGSKVRAPCPEPSSPNGSIAASAERILAAPKVERSELAIEFEQSAASSVALHVEGRNFYPPMLADIAAATSSVHINQFGFRPGVVGDRFAEAAHREGTRPACPCG